MDVDDFKVPAIEGDNWKAAMGSFPSGVTVVTTSDADGVHGTTVSAFSSVSLAPPLLLVCMDLGSRTYQRVAKNLGFAVNILAAEQDDLALRFASSKQIKKFEGVEYKTGASGSPIIAGSKCVIDCQLTDNHLSGDHAILVGKPLQVYLAEEKEPLLYFASKFWGLS